MPFYNLFMLATSLPNFLKRTATYILEKFTSEKRLAERLRSLHDKNHEEINQLYQRWDAWRVAFDNKWREAGISSLVSPC